MSTNPDVQHPNDVNLGAYLAGLRRQKWLIVMTTVIGLALGLAYGQIKTPAYTATATVQVNPPDSQSGGVSSSSSSGLLSTEEIVARSVGVAQIATTNLGSSPTDPGSLLKHLTVTRGVGDANVLDFSYSASSPMVARDGANAFANAYVTFKDQQAHHQYEVYRDSTQAQIDEAAGRIDQLNTRLSTFPKNSGGHQALRAEIGSLTDQVSQLRTNLADAVPTGAPPAEVIQEANLPTSPTSPNTVLAAFAGFMLGFIVGVVWALIRMRRGQRWRGAMDVEEWLGAPVIGMIPKTTERREVVTIREPVSLAAEGYRKLRARLFSMGTHPAKTLLVTSPSSGEDKSAVATNLAVTLAQAGKRTILVSADLREPEVDRLLGIRSTPGFSEVLSGKSSLSMALQPCIVHNLWVLPSGRTSDEDIDTLHSGSVEDFLRTSDLVDYIIIDAAPVLSVADAMVLASQVDGVLIVVNARRLERDDAIWAREELDQVGARIVGIIATQARTGSRRRERAYGSRQALPPPKEGKFEGGAAVPGQVPAGVVTGRLPGSNGQNGEDRDAQAWLQDGPAAGRGDPALPR